MPAADGIAHNGRRRASHRGSRPLPGQTASGEAYLAGSVVEVEEEEGRRSDPARGS